MPEPLFTTRLDPGHRERLEEIFYFNARQQALGPGLEAAIQRHGMPSIIEENGGLRIQLGGDSAAQTLFMLDPAGDPAGLAAVVVFLRPEPQTLAIAHLAVAEDYSATAAAGPQGWGVLLVQQVMEMARRIRGVTRVALPYWTDHPRHLKLG